MGQVLETLEYLNYETLVWFKLTTLLIPGHNDSSLEIEKLSCRVIEHLWQNVPIHITAFHPDWKMRGVEGTPHSTLLHAREISSSNGARHVYLGNDHIRDSSSTYSHGYGKLLIGRDWHELNEWNLEEEGCSSERELTYPRPI